MPIGECDSCGSQKVNVTLTKDEFAKEQVKLCNICYSTIIGNSFLYPNNYDAQTVQALRVLAFCTNEIIREVRKCK